MFDIIGGQYQSYYYGTVGTLEEAKKMALEHDEYWDNWQGWHVPGIYRHEDCEDVENFYGEGRAPGPFAEPVSVYDRDTETWIDME